jgi:DNA-binding PadR family transcriptional regulator
MTLVSLRHAILGFLSLEPTSGYTLQQRFEGSVGSFWTATQSQIYRELHALEAQGHVEVEVQPSDGKPARKVYHLTPSGRAELTRWLEAPAPPVQLRDALQLRLCFAAEVAPATLDATLAGHQSELEARQAEYRARLGDERIFGLARSARERELWRLSIENGLLWCEAQLTWVAAARERLSGLKHIPTSARTRKRT